MGQINEIVVPTTEQVKDKAVLGAVLMGTPARREAVRLIISEPGVAGDWCEGTQGFDEWFATLPHRRFTPDQQEQRDIIIRYVYTALATRENLTVELDSHGIAYIPSEHLFNRAEEEAMPLLNALGLS